MSCKKSNLIQKVFQQQNNHSFSLRGENIYLKILLFDKTIFLTPILAYFIQFSLEMFYLFLVGAVFAFSRCLKNHQFKPIFSFFFYMTNDFSTLSLIQLKLYETNTGSKYYTKHKYVEIQVLMYEQSSISLFSCHFS